MTKKRRSHPPHAAPAKEAEGPDVTLHGAPAVEEPLPEDSPSAPAPSEAEAQETPEGEAALGTSGDGVLVELPREAIRRLEESFDELQDRHARLAAEFDNYKKRVARERLELNDRAQGAFAIRLLEVLDDLDRLVAGAEATEPTMPLHEAVVMVDRKLRKELAAAGLERIESDGAVFDPSVHEAVAAVPAPAPELDQHVAATFQAGYRFKGSLIRPARVQVYTDQG